MMNVNTVPVTVYAEFTEDPSTWRPSRPAFDVDKFNQTLLRKFGRIGDQPRFRLLWGPDSEIYQIEEFYSIRGWQYTDPDGTVRILTDPQEEIPDTNAILMPVTETIKVFIPRFIIEEFNGIAYQTIWTIQRVEERKETEESGKFELVSYYREPGDVDIEILAKYVSVKDSWTEADTRAITEKHLEAEQRRRNQALDEIAVEYAEEAASFLSKPLSSRLQKMYGNIDPTITPKDVEENIKKTIKLHDTIMGVE